MSFDFAAFRAGMEAQNEQVLNDLDIKLPTAIQPATPRKVPVKKAPSTLKAKSSPAPPASAAALVAERENRGLRSSARVRDSLLGLTPKKEEKRVELASDDDEAEEEQAYYEGGKKVKTERGSAPEKLEKRKYNPKTYGAIPGVRPGTCFDFRMAASQASVHAPTVAGIAAGPQGCYSICVSGGYDGDVDLGEKLTYSGSGGRDLKGTADKPKNLRTAAQTSDQTWDNPLNAALLRSVKSQKPIRVLRGFKGRGAYAPVDGYRYDGLYVAAKHWQDENPDGLKICRVALVRLPGQPPIPTQDGRTAGEAPAAIADLDGNGASCSSASDSASTPATSPEPAPSKKKSEIATPKRKRVSTVAAEEDQDGKSSAKRRRSSRGSG
ncbi:hypothetical protein JCM10213_008753 [Rhodosporidiobolus nylandii]